MNAVQGLTRRATVLAGAVALLGGVGMAATSASASGNSPVPVISVVAGGGPTKVATHDISAGWTTFSITSHATVHPGAAVQLLSLRPGVTIESLQSDLLAAGGFSTPAFTTALAQDTILYGGVEVDGGQVGTFSSDLVAGSYYLTNIDLPGDKLASDAVPLTVHGPVVPHRAPASHGTVLMKNMHFFPNPGKLAAAGTVTLTNYVGDDADDIHFLDIIPVAPGTTDKELQTYFDEVVAGTAPKGPPAFAADGPEADSGLLSPGESQLFSYSLPAGTYALLCFITDPDTGLPHAFMGMHKVVTLS